MADKDESCCAPSDRGGNCCNVESLITVDERGQMVLPKEIRDRANIRPGDKLAVISCEKDGEISCLLLIKAESLTQMVKVVVGPMVDGLTQE